MAFDVPSGADLSWNTVSEFTSPVLPLCSGGQHGAVAGLLCSGDSAQAITTNTQNSGHNKSVESILC